MVSEEELKNMSPEEIAEYQKKNCVFCKIIKGEIPSKQVFEDDKIICILDINPAVKGHCLVMPKEHYPILPVIPSDTAAHMFRTTKHLVKALKQGVVAPRTTVFVANGAVAGQQSPHFLYHLIPREQGDGLNNFDIPSNEFNEEDVKKHLSDFKAKITAMMNQYKSSVKKETNTKTPARPEPQTEEQQTEIQEVKENPELEVEEAPKPRVKQNLARFIDSNPNVKNAIMENPEDFKKQLENNPELKKAFQGININKLSAALKSIQTQKES